MDPVVLLRLTAGVLGLVERASAGDPEAAAEAEQLAAMVGGNSGLS